MPLSENSFDLKIFTTRMSIRRCPIKIAAQLVSKNIQICYQAKWRDISSTTIKQFVLKPKWTPMSNPPPPSHLFPSSFFCPFQKGVVCTGATPKAKRDRLPVSPADTLCVFVKHSFFLSVHARTHARARDLLLDACIKSKGKNKNGSPIELWNFQFNFLETKIIFKTNRYYE